MNNFTELINEINESRINYDSDRLLSSEITRYLSKVNKIVPKQVLDAIYLTQHFGLLNSQDIDLLRKSNKSGLSKLSVTFNIPKDSIEHLWQLLKDIKSNIRLLPQFQTKVERDSIMLGKLALDDLTIDLDSQAGRNAATKVYMPMIYKIVNQYLGKSKLSKQELISAALLGFNDAMNNWKKDGEKSVVFKTYAAYRVQQQILNDMNEYSHSLSGTNWYAAKNFADTLDAVSIDGFMSARGDEYDQDKLSMLGVTDKPLASNEEKHWNSLYKLIENNFKQRDIDIFYRYFGLHGYKREKSKDIAKSMGMSEGNIRNSIINKIINFLKKNPKAMEILSDIQDIYNESLMVELSGLSKNEILEALVNDDMFILLEELNQWKNKDVLNNSLGYALDKMGDDAHAIIDILNRDFEYLDSVYKKNLKIIIKFLSFMYPTHSFNKNTDVYLLEKIQELQELIKSYKIKL